STTGEARRITNDVVGYTSLSATRIGDVLVALQSRTFGNLWKMTGSDISHTQQITASGEFVRGFSWTPDGRFLFVSAVSGNSDIWLMNADGTGSVQLTANKGNFSDPFMTRDGRYIVAQQRDDRFNSHIFRMDADG